MFGRLIESPACSRAAPGKRVVGEGRFPAICPSNGRERSPAATVTSADPSAHSENVAVVVGAGVRVGPVDVGVAGRGVSVFGLGRAPSHWNARSSVSLLGSTGKQRRCALSSLRRQTSFAAHPCGVGAGFGGVAVSTSVTDGTVVTLGLGVAI